MHGKISNGVFTFVNGNLEQEIDVKFFSKFMKDSIPSEIYNILARNLNKEVEFNDTSITVNGQTRHFKTASTDEHDPKALLNKIKNIETKDNTVETDETKSDVVESNTDENKEEANENVQKIDEKSEKKAKTQLIISKMSPPNDSSGKVFIQKYSEKTSKWGVAKQIPFHFSNGQLAISKCNYVKVSSDSSDWVSGNDKIRIVYQKDTEPFQEISSPSVSNTLTIDEHTMITAPTFEELMKKLTEYLKSKSVNVSEIVNIVNIVNGKQSCRVGVSGCTNINLFDSNGSRLAFHVKESGNDPKEWFEPVANGGKNLKELKELASQKGIVYDGKSRETLKTLYFKESTPNTPKTGPITMKQATTGSCEYKNIRGEKKGQKCDAKTKTGEYFCSKHNKTDQAMNYIANETELAKQVGKKMSQESEHTQPPSIVRNPKLKVWMVKNYDFIVESARSNIVVGFIKNNEIIPIDESQKELIYSIGFVCKE